MEETFETSNINETWLKNIFEQLKATQTMERMAREGCNDLMEYIQIPMDMRRVILPDVQYKNMKFLALELDLIINNLTPVLKGSEEKFKNRLNPIIKNLDDRRLFLKDKTINGQVVQIEMLPLLNINIMYLSKIKADKVKDKGHLLFIKENEGDKTW